MRQTPPVGTESRRRPPPPSSVYDAFSATPRKLLYSSEGKGRCSHVKSNGERCRNRPVQGPAGISQFCGVHLCRELLSRYQIACAKDENNKGSGFAEARKTIKVLYNQDNIDNRLEWLVSVQSLQNENVSLNTHTHITDSIRRRFDALPPDKQSNLLRLTRKHYAQWKRCWSAREIHRRACVSQESKDKGHEAAYYILKLAVLIGNVLRSSSGKKGKKGK